MKVDCWVYTSYGCDWIAFCEYALFKPGLVALGLHHRIDHVCWASLAWLGLSPRPVNFWLVGVFDADKRYNISI